MRVGILGADFDMFRVASLLHVDGEGGLGRVHVKGLFLVAVIFSPNDLIAKDRRAASLQSLQLLPLDFHICAASDLHCRLLHDKRLTVYFRACQA